LYGHSFYAVTSIPASGGSINFFQELAKSLRLMLMRAALTPNFFATALVVSLMNGKKYDEKG
jgi:hypothetical protein